MSECGDEFSIAAVQQVATPMGIGGRPKVSSPKTRADAADPSATFVGHSSLPRSRRSFCISASPWTTSACQVAQHPLGELARGRHQELEGRVTHLVEHRAQLQEVVEAVCRTRPQGQALARRAQLACFDARRRIIDEASAARRSCANASTVKSANCWMSGSVFSRPRKATCRPWS